ncbi:MAG: hypothetical protein A4E70_01428 [Syntrophus sp. PtaU1.Bin005]|jgi:hypothetical protein|uniref:hypothetical protein n=1 Tax=Syntrophus buswellii TaxID=43774 RepID=UPI0009CDE0FC|nr:hypothetical protein [Bacteroidales bacterium]OPY81160.1 MAG: hypothetical protein A4E70_01428 [Syntrophus sp. PtaU1.Bin005]
MSVASQVADAIKKLLDDRFEDAIIASSVALSATARLENPTLGDKDACRKFLEYYLPIISKIAWGAFGVSQPINFKYRRLDSRKSGIAVRTMPEMLYDVIRCTAVHEAKLPDNLRFTNQSVIQLGNDGELALPIDLIYGLLIAVVASPKNSDQRIEGDPVFSFGGKSMRFNELWGNRDKIEVLIGIK